jgi:hypothetical protein
LRKAAEHCFGFSPEIGTEAGQGEGLAVTAKDSRGTASVAAMKSTETLYWFGVTATFRCRICAHGNIERFVITHVLINVADLNRKAQTYRFFKCQRCGAYVGDEVDLSFCFLPGTPEHLKNKGFPVPSTAFDELKAIRLTPPAILREVA